MTKRERLGRNGVAKATRRGRPFQAGNPGRPPGSKNKVTQFLEQIGEAEADELLQVLVDRAKDGDSTCMRIVMDRWAPMRKGAPMQVDMPPINMIVAMTWIWRAMHEGKLTPDELNSLLPLLDRTISILEVEDFAKRLEALEKEREQRDAKKQPPAT